MKSLRNELCEQFEIARNILLDRWDEAQDDECCTQALEVLEMLIASLE